MKILLASRNKGKISEFQKLFRQYLGDDIEVLSLDAVGMSDDIEENGTTFEENALIKAKAASKTGYISIADDSGLVVPALDGAPGIYSARYSGTHGDDASNNQKLLKELEGISDRRAAFVCCVACVFPDENISPVTAYGVAEGEILCEPRGDGGFGYDPLFWYDDLGKTFAELTEEEKNSISHRSAALRNLSEKLKPIFASFKAMEPMKIRKIKAVRKSVLKDTHMKGKK